MTVLHAHTRPGPALALAGLSIAAIATWAIEHVVKVTTGHPGRFGILFTIACFALLAQTALYSLERPKRTTERTERALNALSVVIPVPAYNEDPELLRACLASLLHQQRMPQVVHIVDDGSKVDYTDVRAWFASAAAEAAAELVFGMLPERPDAARLGTWLNSLKGQAKRS